MTENKKIMLLKKEVERLKKEARHNKDKHNYYRCKTLLEYSSIYSQLASNHLDIYVNCLNLINLNEILIGI